MLGLRSVPSALSGDGAGGREAGAALCLKCFLQHTAHCTLAHRSHPTSRPRFPFLSFFPTHLLLPQRWRAEIESCQRRHGDQEKAFPAGVSP